MDIEASYYANTGEVYGVSAALKWEETEPGFSVHVNDIYLPVTENLWEKPILWEKWYP